MFTETPAADCHDLSAVDALDDHFAKRREDEHAAAMQAEQTKNDVAHSAAKAALFKRAGVAALLGGVGLGAALFGGSFLLTPRAVTNEGPERVVVKEVPGPEHVVVKEVPGPERVVVKEIPGPERVVVKEVPGVERVVTVPGPERIVYRDAPTPGPQTSAKPPIAGPESPYAVRTPEERKFVDQPEYKEAKFRGRIVKSRDGKAISFADGSDYWPALWDGSRWLEAIDPNKMFITDPYVGDLGVCVTMQYCRALHNGEVVGIQSKPVDETATTPQPPSPQSVCDGAYCTSSTGPQAWSDPDGKKSGPTTAAKNMVSVDVFLGTGNPAIATVDTGCSWPMSLPQVLADMLLNQGLAIRAGKTTSILADGSAHDVDVILIKAINVEGRVLQDVEAAVAPSNGAPILLGLGALNRLGPYTITDGRIVFTNDQPT